MQLGQSLLAPTVKVRDYTLNNPKLVWINPC